MLFNILMHIIPFVWLWILTCCLFRLSAVKSLLLLISFIAIGFLPLRGLPLAAYIRGFTDDLSCLNFFVALWMGLRMLQKKSLLSTETSILYFCIGFLGVIFYFMTLVPHHLSIYAWGYSPWLINIVCLLLTLLCVCVRYYGICLLLLLLVANNLWQLFPYGNFWNSALDPIIVLISLGFCVRMLCASKKQRPALLD